MKKIIFTLLIGMISVSLFGQSVTMTINGAYADSSGNARNSKKLQGKDTTTIIASVLANIPTAQSGRTGLLTGSDWNYFNNGLSQWYGLAGDTLTYNNNVGVGVSGNSTYGYKFYVEASKVGYITKFKNTSTNVGSNVLLLQGSTTSGSTTSNFITIYSNNGTSLGSIGWNGTSGSGAAPVFKTVSDKRLKQDITPTKCGLSDLMKINIVDFRWKDKPKGKIFTGVIAQELYKVYPNAVIKPDDETKDVWTLNREELIPLLVKSIQDQQAEITDLTKRIEALEKR